MREPRRSRVYGPTKGHDLVKKPGSSNIVSSLTYRNDRQMAVP